MDKKIYKKGEFFFLFSTYEESKDIVLSFLMTLEPVSEDGPFQTYRIGRAWPSYSDKFKRPYVCEFKNAHSLTSTYVGRVEIL